MKGGSAKTTTVAFLAHALAHGGRRVACVDADPAGSLLRWRDHGEWTLPVLGMASRKVHVDLPNVADRYDVLIVDTPPLDEQAGIVASAVRAATDVLIVDTPPLDEQAGIVASAVRAATDVLIPVAPSTMELDRLPPILAVIDDAAALATAPPGLRVLLTRAVTRASSVEAARQVIVEDLGRKVLTTVIPRLERYALAFGGPVVLPAGDAYALAADELERMLA